MPRREPFMDLNLVRTFVAVHETRNLTVAAARLYVSQPAVSQALAKLRRALGDPLFERTGRTMEPTPLAQSVYPGFRDSLVAVDRALDAVHTFDPRTSEHRFRVAMSELGEIGYFPALFSAVRTQAPGVSVDVVPLDLDRLPGWLGRGTVDLAVTSLPLTGSFEHEVLKFEGYVALMGRGHPLATQGADLPGYLQAHHAVVSGDSGRPTLEAALRRVGASITPAATVNHFASLPPLLATRDDLIATVPVSIAAGWATSWPLAMRELPFELVGAEVSLLKRTTAQHAAALDWFYRTALRALRGEPGEFSAIGAPPTPDPQD
ncbi:MAG: LysR family transcriptional regulator [Citricoccus sp.]